MAPTLRALGALASVLPIHAALGGVPPFIATDSYRSGNSLTGGFGTINSPFFFPNGGDGLMGLGITTGGDVLAHVEVQALDFQDAVLWSPQSLVAVLEADFEDFFSGSCTTNVPCAFHIMEDVFGVSVNNNDDRVYIMSLLEIGSTAEDEKGVFWDVDHALVLEGDPIVAAGLAGGTTVETIDAQTFAELNDSNQVLISLDVNEGGTVRRALVRFDLNGSGDILSATTVAKEGGLAGAGPATWTEIGIGAHAQAINDSGTVVFSGSASDGTAGIFKDGAFLAVEGGAAPGGLGWDSLVAQSVDISNTGSVAFRGVLSAAVPFVWDEVADAGPVGTGANTTVGTGALNTINGTLSNENDIDLYKIRVTDPASFSATTLGGASFDSVLYMFQDGFSANGVTRSGLARNNDIDSNTRQSALTGQHLPIPDPFGTTYYLGVSTSGATPSSTSINAINGQFEPDEIWNSAPRDLMVHDGILYWPEPASGVLRRVDIATATAMADLPVSMIPDSQIGTGEEFLQPALAVDPAAHQLYYLALPFLFNEIRRSNLDGTAPFILDLDGDATLSRISDLHFDTTTNKLYWSDLNTGEIWQSDPDGENEIAIFDEPLGNGGTLTFDEIAVDPTAGKIYWANPLTGDIGRSNLNGTSVETISAGADAAEFAIDVAGRRLFFTQPGQDRISQINLDTLAVTGLFNTRAPVGIAYDAATDALFWSNSAFSAIYMRDLTAGPGGSGGGLQGDVTKSSGGLPVTNAGTNGRQNGQMLAPPRAWFASTDTLERTADGPGWDAQLGNAWTTSGRDNSGPLPYTISLTGAEFSGSSVAISKDNLSIVAQTSTTLPDIAPHTLTSVSTDAAPLNISDTGAVLWFGRWADGGVVDERGVFIDSDLLYTGDTPVAGLPAGVGHTPVPDDAFSMDMSEDGRYIVLKSFNGSFSSPLSHSLGDISIIIEFTGALPITWGGPDHNRDGIVGIADLIGFVDAFNRSDPSADADENGRIDFFDLITFVNEYKLAME